MTDWVNCCKGRKCPHIKLGDEEARIRDDFGNEVKMSLNQFSDLLDKGRELLVEWFPPTEDEVN